MVFLVLPGLARSRETLPGTEGSGGSIGPDLSRDLDRSRGTWSCLWSGLCDGGGAGAPLPVVLSMSFDIEASGLS